MNLDARRNELIRRILTTEDTALLRVVERLFTGWSMDDQLSVSLRPAGGHEVTAEDEILDAHLAVARARAERVGRGEADLRTLEELVGTLRKDREAARR